jgi:hypothetical protein
MRRSDRRGLVTGGLAGLSIGTVAALALVPIAGLGFNPTTGGATGVMSVSAGVCAPGPSRQVRVQVFRFDSRGSRISYGDQTSFGPFLFELSPGNYTVFALGKTRSVSVTANQISRVTMGFTGTCYFQ